MRRLVYDARGEFAEIERRLSSGERIVTLDVELPRCNRKKGKVFFYRQGDGVVVGICGEDNETDIEYRGICRDLKYFCEHKKILFPNVPAIFNMFYRFAAEYETKGGKLTYFVDNYGYYKDGKYQFELEKVGITWRAYIVRTPPITGRDTSAVIVHQLSDGGRKYVCVNGAVSTKERMITIAEMWARAYQNYIVTGETIDSWYAKAKKKKG